MNKRRLNQQQSKRIAQQQAVYRQAGENQARAVSDGLVITSFGRNVLLEDQNGVLTVCAIRPTLDVLVAGDRVVWQHEDGKNGIVISLYPRNTVLARPNQLGIMRAVAANLTQVLIVIAPKPEISWPLLDSYLVMVEQLCLKPKIVLNKTDLPCDEIKTRLQQQYAPLGYPIILTNRESDFNAIAFSNHLHQEISVFVGQSGVGKSSLIASILPLGHKIRTGKISIKSELGRHTTSNAHYYHLSGGGGLIDSPGIREFGLWHLSTRQIAQGYREFLPHLDQCKFRNCTHEQTPGCAIIQAVNEKKICWDRYANYVRISNQFAK